MANDSEELARLRAVEKAIKAELAEPGPITKTEIRAALATKAPSTDPVGDVVEDAV